MRRRQLLHGLRRRSGGGVRGAWRGEGRALHALAPAAKAVGDAVVSRPLERVEGGVPREADERRGKEALRRRRPGLDAVAQWVLASRNPIRTKSRMSIR